MEISSISSSMNFDSTSLFTKWDTDGSGGIDKDEFLANVKRMDGDTDEKLEKMFEETDTDGDGIISQAENDAVMERMSQGGQKMQGPPPAKPADSSSSGSSTTTTYDVRDTNEDGEVSTEEKLEYILKLIEEQQEADSTQNQYTLTGASTESSSMVTNTFSVKA